MTIPDLNAVSNTNSSLESCYALELAIDGGQPVRSSFLPYAAHWIGEEEKNEVIGVLNSGWLTTGPKVKQFEEDLARYAGAKFAIAVNSGTAALHCCMAALDIKPGDEVITTPFTFLATVNSIIYLGGTPVLADVDKNTFNINPQEIRKKITSRTKAIIPVHYGGLPCEMDEILSIARRHNLKVVEDAAHALSAEYNSRRIGSFGDATIFSFHPVKNITTAEGGMILTNDAEIAKRCVMHRTHGITKEAMERYGKNADWMYDMQRIGYRYNMTEFQAALGVAQLKKIDCFQKRREEIVASYDQEFSKIPELIIPPRVAGLKSSWHLYVVRIREELLTADRNQIIKALKAENIGVNVHYIPIHLHSYYQQNYGLAKGMFPITENIYDSIITLPLFPKMGEQDVQDVIIAVKKVIGHYQKKPVLNNKYSDKYPSVSTRPSSLSYPSCLSGETIQLVPFSEQHLHDSSYLSWLRDQEVMRYARRDYSSEMTFENAERYVQALWKSTRDFFFAIETKSSKDSRKFVGTLKLGHIDWEAGIADLGIMIGDKAMWGKGLATEACQIALAYCFGELNLHKVMLGCKEPNQSMVKVAQKLGFTQEGYFRDQNLLSGRRYGHYHFGLLKKDYENKNNQKNTD